MFKIFYSWQSDLPNNKTRSFIRKCIDEAIDLAQDSEAIEAMRDEATLDVTGSPDIVSTLFSKIKDCDLFVADVSLCYTEDIDRKKKSPNPNVMLELGYAVNELGWEHVICLANIDFGDDFPFDFDHNRRTAYSLEGNNLENEKNRVSKIIFKNIRDLRNAPPRAKNGMASHILGSYDLAKQKVANILVPINIEVQEGYVLHNQELIEESKKLIDEICGINIPEELKMVEEDKPVEYSEDGVQIAKPVSFRTEYPVRIDVEDERINIKKWLGIVVDGEFFNCGNLKKETQLFGDFKELIGTEEQKKKYKLLMNLSYNLGQLDMRSLYIKTFEGLKYIPLAIQNISNTDDHNIRVVVHVTEGEIIEPNKDLIYEKLEGFQGLICRNEDENNGVGVIDELFTLPEDGNIHIEFAPYDESRFRIKTPILTMEGLRMPGKDEEDYEYELQDYIASSVGSSYYEFDISALRPNECRWMSQGMLIKPVNNRVRIKYQIHSSNTSGELSGEFELVV